MAKIKKRCLHCEFIRATERKYPAWARAGSKPHKHDRRVLEDMRVSWVKIGAMLLTGMTEEERMKSLSDIYNRSMSIVVSAESGISLDDIIQAAGATKQ